MPRPSPRIRDAARTRVQVLDAAEAVFAREGFDAASLARIGEVAGVSRGTPSYFFGSKEQLYVAVLERMYADRTAALAPAFAPLVAWATSAEPPEPLRAALDRAVGAYLGFVSARPSYVDIIEREALAGGGRLAGLANQSTVMEDAFGALRANAARRGLREFDAADAILAFVSLGYMPVAHRNTMLRRHALAFDAPAFIAARRTHIVDILLHLVGAGA
jgi:TetR/AcrR family transcriptional regulator